MSGKIRRDTLAAPRGISAARVLTWSLAILYGVVLVVYYPWLSERLHVREYPLTQPSFLQLAFAWIAYLFPLAWMQLRLDRPSQMILWFLYVTLYAPAIFVPHFVLDDVEPLRLVILDGVLCLQMALLWFVTRVPPLHVPWLRIHWTGYLVLILVSLIVLEFVVIRAYGLTWKFVSIFDVYGVRRAYKQTMHEQGLLAAFAPVWLAFVSVPLLVSTGLTWGRRHRFGGLLFVALALLVSVHVFVLSGLKGAVFSAAMVLVFWWIAGFRSQGFAILGGTLALFGITGVVALTGVDWFLVHFVRRLIVVPGLHTGYYFEYFSNNDLYYLSHSVLRRWVRTSYELPPSLQIGLEYYGSTSTSANANFWADGFANFGWIGVGVATMLLAVFLWLTDSLATRHRLRFSVPLFAMVTYALANTGLLTTLNTYGWLYLLMFLWLAPTTDEEMRVVPRHEADHG